MNTNKKYIPTSELKELLKQHNLKFTFNGIHVVVLSKIDRPDKAYTVLVAEKTDKYGILRYVDQYSLSFKSDTYQKWFTSKKCGTELTTWDWRYLLDLNKTTAISENINELYKYFDGIIPDDVTELFVKVKTKRRPKKSKKTHWKSHPYYKQEKQQKQKTILQRIEEGSRKERKQKRLLDKQTRPNIIPNYLGPRSSRRPGKKRFMHTHPYERIQIVDCSPTITELRKTCSGKQLKKVRIHSIEEETIKRVSHTPIYVYRPRQLRFKHQESIGNYSWNDPEPNSDFSNVKCWIRVKEEVKTETYTITRVKKPIYKTIRTLQIPSKKISNAAAFIQKRVKPEEYIPITKPYSNIHSLLGQHVTKENFEELVCKKYYLNSILL